jgi:hypothetical protein
MKLADVNTTDIRDAIALGCATMGRVFDADDGEGDIPFFDVFVRPQARMAFSPWGSECHVPGRHLNALLNAEDAAGIEIDEDAVDRHARAAFYSYSGPIAFPLNRDVVGGTLIHFAAHHAREGFHALYAMEEYRDSDRARAVAEAAIDAINEYWDPDNDWDYDRLGQKHGLVALPNQPFMHGLARAIGPLGKYYRATGYGPALGLATVLKNKCLAEVFDADGSYDKERFGEHTHSTTCVMSSLAQLADLTSDAALMNRVKAFYDNGLWDIRDEFGWVIESSGEGRNPDKGEVNNSGDILETALILGKWGFAEGYHDAERILRCHILPSQLRDVSFIAQPANPDGVDGMRDVAARLRGAFGFPAPYGHEPADIPEIKFNLDIVGGTVGSLCEALRSTTTHNEAGHHINLLFDHITPDIAVESPYTHPALRVRVKRPGPLHVRIPPWVDHKALQVEGVAGRVLHTEGYAFIAEPPINRWLTFRFPLAEQEISLRHRTRTIRTRMRGDAVDAMENFGADLTFFDPLD